MSLPDFSDVKFNLASVTQYFENHGVELSAENKSQLNTIFESCDTYNEADNQDGADGFISKHEVSSFMNMISTVMPFVKEQINNFVESFKPEAVSEIENEMDIEGDIKSADFNPPAGLTATTDIRTNYDWSEEEFNKVLTQMLDAPRYRGKFKNSVLRDKGKAFIEAGKKYNIDPRALLAIAMCESARGMSSIAQNKNNVGGLRGSGGYLTFESVDASIDKIAEILSKRYDQGLTTLTKIGQSGKYCAKSASSHWIKEGSSYLASFNNHYLGDVT